MGIPASSFANRGRGFEKTLELTHMMYANQDIAYIDKKEVPTTVKRGKVVYLARTGFDYEGIWVGSGRFICMEAKEHKERLPIDLKNKSGLKMHQIKELIRYGKAGAWSAVVWNISDLGVTYMLDWQFLDDFMANVYGIRKEKGKLVKSIRPSMIENVCPMVDRDGVPDYLMALGRKK